jgi:hypothetical protein
VKEVAERVGVSAHSLHKWVKGVKQSPRQPNDPSRSFPKRGGTALSNKIQTITMSAGPNARAGHRDQSAAAVARVGRESGCALRYGEDKYFFTVMGRPSAQEPWGWQLDGHHLIVNFFVLGDEVVITPLFLGGEPVVTTSGKYVGNAVLQDEQNQGLALLQSFSEEQRKSAVRAITASTAP